MPVSLYRSACRRCFVPFGKRDIGGPRKLLTYMKVHHPVRPFWLGSRVQIRGLNCAVADNHPPASPLPLTDALSKFIKTDAAVRNEIDVKSTLTWRWPSQLTRHATGTEVSRVPCHCSRPHCRVLHSMMSNHALRTTTLRAHISYYFMKSYTTGR